MITLNKTVIVKLQHQIVPNRSEENHDKLRKFVFV